LWAWRSLFAHKTILHEIVYNTVVLGGLPAETLARMRGIAWAFALCFAAITVVSWRYLFIIPVAFSLVIT